MKQTSRQIEISDALKMPSHVRAANTFISGFHEYSHKQALYKHDLIMLNATSKIEIFPSNVLLFTVT